MTRFLAAGLALAVAGAAAAQVIYRWTDEKGRVQYGNEPPARAKAKPIADRINSYSGPVEVRRTPTASASAAPPDGLVVMYSTSWCTYCAQARAYFARNRIRYQEHDVEHSAAANAEYKRLGGRGVPLIVYEGQVMSGFTERAFQSLVARSRR